MKLSKMKPGEAFVGDDGEERFTGVVVEHGTEDVVYGTRVAFDDGQVDWVMSDWEVTLLAPVDQVWKAACEEIAGTLDWHSVRADIRDVDPAKLLNSLAKEVRDRIAANPKRPEGE
jgi:hypothetical protein